MQPMHWPHSPTPLMWKPRRRRSGSRPRGQRRHWQKAETSPQRRVCWKPRSCCCRRRRPVSSAKATSSMPWRVSPGSPARPRLSHSPMTPPGQCMSGLSGRYGCLRQGGASCSARHWIPAAISPNCGASIPASPTRSPGCATNSTKHPIPVPRPFSWQASRVRPRRRPGRVRLTVTGSRRSSPYCWPRSAHSRDLAHSCSRPPWRSSSASLPTARSSCIRSTAAAATPSC